MLFVRERCGASTKQLAACIAGNTTCICRLLICQASCAKWSTHEIHDSQSLLHVHHLLHLLHLTDSTYSPTSPINLNTSLINASCASSSCTSWSAPGNTAHRNGLSFGAAAIHRSNRSCTGGICGEANSSFSDQRARVGAEKRPKEVDSGWACGWGLGSEGEEGEEGRSDEK